MYRRYVSPVTPRHTSGTCPRFIPDARRSTGLVLERPEEGEKLIRRQLLGPHIPGQAQGLIGRGDRGRGRASGQVLPEHLAALGEGGAEEGAIGLVGRSGVKRSRPAAER